MTLGDMLVVAAAVVLPLAGYKLYVNLRHAAHADGEDHADWRAFAWQAGLLVAGLCGGVLAVVTMFRSVPRGDWGFGGVIFIAAAPLVFGLGYVLAQMVARALGQGLPDLQRGALVAAVLAATVAVVGLPMLRSAQDGERRQALQRNQHEQFARLQAEKKQVPHAPAGTVPPQLALESVGGTLNVTNRTDAPLVVHVAFVLTTPAWSERCDAFVEYEQCAPGAPGCAYSLAKDGTRVPAGRGATTAPTLGPGQRAAYIHRCTGRFAQAPLEFRIYHPGDQRWIFKSESAFVPQLPG